MKSSIKTFLTIAIALLLGATADSLYTNNMILTGQWQPEIVARNHGYYVQWVPENLDDEI